MVTCPEGNSSKTIIYLFRGKDTQAKSGEPTPVFLNDTSYLDPYQSDFRLEF